MISFFSTLQQMNSWPQQPQAKRWLALLSAVVAIFAIALVIAPIINTLPCMKNLIQLNESYDIDTGVFWYTDLNKVLPQRPPLADSNSKNPLREKHTLQGQK